MPPKQQMHRNGDFGNLELKGGGIASCMEHVLFPGPAPGQLLSKPATKNQRPGQCEMGERHPNAGIRKWTFVR